MLRVFIKQLKETYRNKETENASKGKFGERIPAGIRKRTQMRVDRIKAAVELNDLLVPPSHRFEVLKGDRKGQHNIRINAQWCVCFSLKDGHGTNVEITNYH